MSGALSKDCGCGCGRPTLTSTARFRPGHYVRDGSAVDFVVEAGPLDTPCWVWQRRVNNRGYGLAQRGGRKTTAHRWYWEERFGPVPQGLELDHLCRNRLCVNPAHMEPVTPEVNRQRGKNAKLTHAQVRTIRASSLSSREMGASLGVSHTAINDVRAGRRWSNVA